jgi:hypothetical protein
MKHLLLFLEERGEYYLSDYLEIYSTALGGE